MTPSYSTHHQGTWALAGLMLGLTLAVTGCRSSAPDSAFADVPGLTRPAPGGATRATGHTSGAVAAVPVVNSNAAAPGIGPDVIHVGEPLEVIFSDLPFPQAPFKERVKDDGTITLLQNQTFVAAGKARGDLEREIRARYVPQYFRQLTVTITPQERFYYVGGEVKAPGRQFYSGHMTVLRAIQSSGDFTDFAKQTKVRLTRVDGTTFIIDAKKARKNPKLDREVFPGDTIDVPRGIW